MTGLRLLVDELLVLRLDRRLPRWRLAIYTAAIAAITLWSVPGVVTERIPFSSDGHAIVSYDVAVTTALCGLPSRFNPTHHPARFMADNAWASDLPAGDVLAAAAGSIETYCSTATVPYVNEDHTVGLIETAFLKVRPSGSAVEIARLLAAIRLVVVLVFAAALLSFGASVLLAGAVAVAATAITADLQRTGFAYSSNPFFIVIVLLNAVAFAVALVLVRSPRVTRTLPGAMVAGFVAAISANMRSSYLPIFAVFFIVYAVAAWRLRPHAERRWLHVAALLPCFLIGYFLFHYPFIARPAQVAAISNYTYHTVSHPLVLGLALPENELSKREGIQWLDEIGNSLARRIDPTTSYLLPGYEKAMFTYYFQLWDRYPREMLAVYLNKLSIAGADMIHYQHFKQPWIPAALWPLSMIHDGLYFFALLIGLALASFVLFWRTRTVMPFCVTVLTIAGALLYLESAVIVPFYYPHYHSYLLFTGLFVSFLVYQLALNLVVAASVRAINSLSGSQGRPHHV